MDSIESIDKIITTLLKYKNIESQANARYILYGVHEDKDNFPKFNIRLTEEIDYLAYLNLEVACSLFEIGKYSDAVKYFEKGATLLEYNHAASRENSYSDFNLMICGLAYYSAYQYSKSFIIISKVQYCTNFTKIISNFLTKRFDLLEENIKSSLLDNTKVEIYDNIFEILLARAMSFVVCYFNYGKNEYLQQANNIIYDAKKLAIMGNDPSIWWEFRLLHVITSQIDKSSLWGCLYNNNSFKVNDNGWEEALIKLNITNVDWNKSAHEAIKKYIHSLNYRNKPITELFSSQRKALLTVLSSESSVVSMPTSSGKTRIAEIAMLQSLLYDNDSKVLYIAPFRSLAYEMEETFNSCFSSLDIGVSYLYGGSQYTALDKAEISDARILIVTPEKAKAILRSNDDIVSSIKLVVMDEGHILGASNREIVNEMFTEELRRIVKLNNGKFLVLSAVLPNAQDLSLWLANKEDRVIKSDWKPSNQRIGLLCYYNERIDIEWQGEYKCFNKSFIVNKGNKKEALAKATKKLSELGSVLIYCPQNRFILSNAKTMYTLVKDEPDIDWGDDSDWIKFSLLCQESEDGKNYLKFAKKGILCHGSILNQDLRRYMEKLLRKGKALYIYATNTLAQGVNLGVSTVIITNVIQGKDKQLSKNDFWNMAGRAGRSFVDTEGKILFFCDCSDKEKWHRNNAHNYIDQLETNDAVSGVYQCLNKLCQIQDSCGVDIDKYLQLIAENRTEEISSNNEDIVSISNIFELIDDSLLALDISYRNSDNDNVCWVDNHFRNALSIIQEKDEKLRQKYINIIKVRIKALRSIIKEANIPQPFASSGIPIKVALCIENKLSEIISIANEYLESESNSSDIITFFEKFDKILENIDSSRIKVPNDITRNESMKLWISGKNIDSKKEEEIRIYYSYTVPWILNAIANRFFSEDDNVYKDLFENMSLIASYGVPSKSAVLIYLCGIHSRLSATELSEHLENINSFEKIQDIVSFIKSNANSIVHDNHYSDLTKEWVRIFTNTNKSNTQTVKKMKNFKFSEKGNDIPELLLCKRYNKETYLCSEDYKFKIKVKDTYSLHFSDIADIPGIYFQKENKVWKMCNVNPFLDIE